MAFLLFKRTIGINGYFFSVNNKEIRNAASELFTNHKYKNGKILFSIREA